MTKRTTMSEADAKQLLSEKGNHLLEHGVIRLCIQMRTEDDSGEMVIHTFCSRAFSTGLVLYLSKWLGD